MKLKHIFPVLSLVLIGAAQAQQPTAGLLSKRLANPSSRTASASQGDRAQIITQASDTATPWVVNGDGMRTRYTLVNLENTAATYQIVFVTSEGTQYRVPWAGMDPTNVLRGTIQPNSTLEFVTDGHGETTQGWSLASATGARVIFTAQNERMIADGVWHSTSYYPSNSLSKKVKVRFDNRDGYTTKIIVNNLNTAGTRVAITVRDADGNTIGELEGFMDAANQYGIDVREDFPLSQGLAGTIEIAIPTTNRSGVSALGVRLNSETGGIDMFDAFSTVAWSQ